MQLLLATAVSLLSLVLTGIIHACFFLSPLFNLTVNIVILLLWTVGLALLTWNMYGTLGHSCSRANWASDDGIMICRTYKALYSFALFGWLTHVALIVLDVRSRRAQTAQGRYDRMMSSGPAQNVKMDTLDAARGRDGAGNGTGAGAGPGTDFAHPHSHSTSQDVPYGVPDYRDESRMRSYRQGRGGGGDPHASHSQSDIGLLSNHAGHVRMDDFHSSYAHLPAHTGYANGGYGYEPQR